MTRIDSEMTGTTETGTRKTTIWTTTPIPVTDLLQIT
jgi:hypothetical protein